MSCFHDNCSTLTDMKINGIVLLILFKKEAELCGADLLDRMQHVAIVKSTNNPYYHVGKI